MDRPIDITIAARVSAIAANGEPYPQMDTTDRELLDKILSARKKVGRPAMDGLKQRSVLLTDDDYNAIIDFYGTFTKGVRSLIKKTIPAILLMMSFTASAQKTHLDTTYARKYSHVDTRYYCDKCPFKWVVFTNIWSGSLDGKTWFELDSAYIKKYLPRNAWLFSTGK